jgi:hypothetical protein
MFLNQRRQLRCCYGFADHHLRFLIELVENHSGHLGLAELLCASIRTSQLSDHKPVALMRESVDDLFDLNWIKVERQYHYSNHLVVVRNQQRSARIAVVKCPVHYDVFDRFPTVGCCSVSRYVAHAEQRRCSVVAERIAPGRYSSAGFRVIFGSQLQTPRQLFGRYKQCQVTIRVADDFRKCYMLIRGG